MVGAIHVEASNWPEDNHWVLEVADGDPIIVGVIGNLRAEEDDFAKQIERLAANPLFRGIRYGRLWGYDLSKQVDNPAFIDAMKLMAQAGLVLDSANPNLDLVQGWLTLTDRVPDLTLIIDHLPYFDPPPDQQAEYERLLGILSERPQVFVKLSEVIHRVEGQVSKDLATHRPRLDLLFDLFGEDQVIFGSDWPNSDGVATIEEVFAIVRAFFATKPRDVAEKYFWKNSVRAYRWIRRAPNQPETT